MKKTVITLAAAGVAVTGLAAPSRADGLERFQRQPLTWKKCTLGPGDQVGKDLDKAGARCADVTVPMDYASPGDRTVKVAISRLPAADRRHRVGAMVVNGGGPGPAIDMPPYLKGLMGKAGERFDLIGMDPRGLGRSTPVDCKWPTGTWIRSAGTSRASFDRATALARDLAKRCEPFRDYLPHISTRNIARDMDVVRAALGERKISYNGASYGNYLGGVYATMFPGRLDRAVLDSGIDPDGWGGLLAKSMPEANERAFARWADWAARRDGTYRLGATRGAVLATVKRTIAASARTPLRLGEYRVDDNVVPAVLMGLLQDDRDPARAALADAAAQMARAAAGRTAPPTGALKESLAFVLTGAESRYGSAQAALICGDGGAPGDPEYYRGEVERSRATAPIFGPLGHNINPCAFWPVEPREPKTRIGAHAGALLVGATGDTRTTYAGTRILHGLLRGSRLVTLRDADVHSPYQIGYGNACVDDAVNRYQLTGRLPARDVTCGK